MSDVVVTLNPTGREAGSFRVGNGSHWKDYHVDSLELADGDGIFKRCSTTGAKMHEVAQIIQRVVQQKIDSGELDPENLPDNLNLEFTRKQFQTRVRISPWIPILGWIPKLAEKIEGNEHPFDTKIPYKVAKLWYTATDGKRKEIAVNDDPALGQAFTRLMSTDVALAKKPASSHEEPPVRHIENFMIPTVENGDCAADALRKAFADRGLNMANDQIRITAADTIRDEAIFRQLQVDGGYFEPIVHALQEAVRDGAVERVIPENQLVPIRGLLADFRNNRLLTPVERDNLVLFYAEYVRHPGVFLDSPFFAAFAHGMNRPFAILVRDEGGGDNPGYRIQQLFHPPGVNPTVDNTTFVIYNGHNHYLAADHRAASVERRQTILGNYQQNMPLGQFKRAIAAFDPTVIRDPQTPEGMLANYIRALHASDVRKYQALGDLLMSQPDWMPEGGFADGIEDQQMARIIFAHLDAAKPLIAALA